MMNNEQLKESLLQLNLEEAIKMLTQYGDKQPLIDIGKTDMLRIASHDKGHELLMRALDGQRLGKEGRGAAKQQPTEIKHLEILCYLYFLKGQGVPIKGEYKNGKETAFQLAADKFHKSESQIGAIWKKRKETLKHIALFNRENN
ncbi:hypothetical protein SAMN02927930_00097 [Pseudidiomarina indica]|uniref:Uncharacterized protein n=1 Tax=Pseudidiomarina indica TaxID=1159017 RepID=A0A1G6A423_9GAMM|nr:hypothetical protein [Pseudidiomarina indica]SDB02763.1 hypothetical protein SAMN02927930_00097 [Pseudidiomarina indica]